MRNEKLVLTRTLGFEIEGFVYSPSDMNFDGYAEVGYDGSLHGGDGEEVEVRSEPINDLNHIEDIYEELNNNGLNVNDTCGLHIHVDISDYSIKEKANLLRFGAGIELLMYALNDPERYYGRGYSSGNRNREGGGYSTKLHKSWRKIFRQDLIGETPIPYDTFRWFDELFDYINNSTGIGGGCWNGKYQWMNANVEDYPTVEFRIFNATTDEKLAVKYGMLAYHIVETVKNSTVKQLSFIIKSLYESTSLEEMYDKLFDSIGLDHDFRPTVRNQELADYIYNKYCVPNQENVAEVEAV